MHCKIKSIIFSLSWIVILAVAVSSFAQQNKRIIPNKADTVVGIGLQSTLGEQKRSAIVEADGYAFFSEDKTIRQLREEAIANAKRVALEQAQTYVKSFTQVENFVLRYDLVQSEAEGYLRILQSKDYGVQPDYRYRYWIKAEIEYALKESEAETKPASLFQNANTPLTVQVWTEKAAYTEGEEMHVFLEANKNFYARVIYVDSQGNIVQLLPNLYRSTNHFMGSKIYQIPDPAQGDQFQLRVKSPFGPEEIIVYASTTSQDSLPLDEAGDGLYRYRGSKQELNMKARGIKVVESQNSIRAAEFYQATWNVLTQKK